jgi:aminoglycoside phosphotransferase (APT) family kinase protein
MAIRNRTDLDRAAHALPVVLERRLAAISDARVTNVRMPQESGMSNETLMFDAAWSEGATPRMQAMVARIAPTADGIYLDYDIQREYRLMSALGSNRDVPVPMPVLFEPDPGPLGAPFFVMPFIAGRCLADDPPYTVAGWLTEVDADSRALLIDNVLKVLAGIHAVDWRDLDLDFATSEDPSAVLGKRLDHESRFYAWASDGESHPVVDAALAWLRANRPADGPLVLNWGDARISNAIYDDDLNVAAVLDWERASIASPEQDLGWWLFAAKHHTTGIGAPDPSGFPDAATTVARYEQLTGHACQNIAFYEILAGVQGCNMMMRAARTLTSAGLLPAGNSMALNNPASIVLADLMGLAPMAGETISFIGNRA